MTELLISALCLALLVPIKEINTRFRSKLRTPIPGEIVVVRAPAPALPGSCAVSPGPEPTAMSSEQHRDEAGSGGPAGVGCGHGRVGATLGSVTHQSPLSPQVLAATGVCFASSLDTRYDVQIVGHLPAG